MAEQGKQMSVDARIGFCIQFSITGLTGER